MFKDYQDARAQGMPIVFANGCFDLLHPGHVSLLEYSASLGFVVVGLNSDRSVSLLKGSGRPVMSESEREYMLLACKFVGQVVIFDEETPLRTIERIRPDLIVKGGDYAEREVVGAHIAEVRLFAPVFDFSTSKLIAETSKFSAKAGIEVKA
jgi:D-beta-D-heptose 7-phosphate kinase / D-beta-D-heptose 1-phosphate adenosyltransferase